ncbi:hypothetical protein B7463_g9892, partial [Scytalidium lignicola]
MASPPITKPDTPDQMEAIITRFYNDIWNVFDVSPADEIIAPDVTFRGTLAEGSTDREGFKRYVREIGAAFPDFYQRIDEMYTDGETCIAQMYWTGTHTNVFRGVQPTGRKFAYPGVGIFKIHGGMIRECWVVGDTWEMWKVILDLERK